MKKRPEEKPIIGVKKSLSAFQKAQEQEKWPRNYEVVIHLQNRQNQFYTCLNWKLTGSISFKPDIDDQGMRS
ncbi:hypothetical protein DY000_02053665 [Brassica cretica]|uniref:Uncharacterized protein n=1 Tax=Brassica cretica TaxID=69181 RepID=A0ABQ7AIH0_BRACR|nr:hypothetical protein DY000_02053665 [Brassica cretica]